MDWSRLFQPEPVGPINVANGVMIEGVIETVGYIEYRQRDNLPFIRLYLKIDSDLFKDYVDDYGNEYEPGKSQEIIQIIVFSHNPGYKYLEYCCNRYINNGQTPAKGLKVSIHHAQFNHKNNTYNCSNLSRVQIVKYKCDRCLSRNYFFYLKDLEKHDREVHEGDPDFMTHSQKLSKKLKLDKEKKDWFDRVFSEGCDSDEECEDRAKRRNEVFDRPSMVFYS